MGVFASFLSTLRQRLSRITSSQRFIPEVDGLRFVAIAMVVLYHVNRFFYTNGPAEVVTKAAGGSLFQFLSIGNFGVPLFFSISGFILAVPFAEHYLAKGQRVSLKRYFFRRLTRLEPPYIIALLLYFSKTVFAHQNAQVLIPHLAASLFYIHNLIYHEASTIMFVAWSLEIEVQFYIVMPMLAKMFHVQPAGLRRALIAGLIFFCTKFAPDVSSLNLLAYLQFFLIGILLADFYVLDWKSEAVGRRLWDLLGAGSWLLLVLILINHWYVQFLSPICVFCAYAGAFRGKIWNWLFSRPLLVTIGGMCYTIYLYHPMIKFTLGRLTVQHTVTDAYWLNVLIQIAILFPAIVCICAVLFALLERPFMRRDWTQRVAKRFLEIRTKLYATR